MIRNASFTALTLPIKECRPVGAYPFDAARYPGFRCAPPWAMESDPLGVGRRAGPARTSPRRPVQSAARAPNHLLRHPQARAREHRKISSPSGRRPTSPNAAPANNTFSISATCSISPYRPLPTPTAPSIPLNAASARRAADKAGPITGIMPMTRSARSSLAGAR
jgi:hypothetical protein